jgi:hypothetical protein
MANINELIQKATKGQVTSLIIDTISEISYNAYVAEKGKLNYDKWRDYGIEYYNFYKNLQKLGFEVVQIIGEYGTGKSYGIKGFEKGECIWINIDNKNPTWEGGRAIYGTKNKPHPFYNITYLQTYNQVLSVAQALRQNAIFNEEDGKPPIAFLLAHVQDYKSGDLDNPIKQSLKIMGNQAKELGVEGLVENTLYTKIVIEDGGPKYYFVTRPNGANTVRTLEGMFKEPLIPNNLKTVADAIRNY